MLQTATTQGLADLHNMIHHSLEKYGRNLGTTTWGWPGGSDDLEDTFLFTMKNAILLLGPQDLDNRWWLGVALEDQYPEGQLVPIFEFNIPKEPNRQLSIIFTRRGNLIEALHKGKFTIGKGSISTDIFFEYYSAYPSHWPVIIDDDVQYLILFTFDLDHFGYSQFYSFISTLTSFAEYVTWFKDEHR